ncbi:MAG: ATP-binding protein, partial [Arcobacteraceae bacterium]|nr:ATP-binding protein [Arcobacteraceae bacterium]
LIDNNLSNAIKYSERNSTITIILEENSLQFITFGTPIKDVKKVFTKYYREIQIVGGYGLGLGIVKEIAKTYKITTTLTSDTKNGTNFTYQFKCHFDAIS